eukprot:CAMPEP_0201571966 /NCGR_PEP_ID=MMETSP0190_2-20130828/14989_1 /ASSEMBLY_ACC=CAM_ASM_000263 /TAXON_ID=37353 /ORGANISM="Rosalina sp." /LENGTH=91 /DNA_ID=CAMNT_0047997185 /DNA_START=1 /DNA_END=272 /DNA_ORIENTATION=-
MEEVFSVVSLANARYWGRNTNYMEGVCGIINAVDDYFLPVQQLLRKNDVRWAFGPDNLIDVAGPDVSFANCPENTILKSASAPDVVPSPGA